MAWYAKRVPGEYARGAGRRQVQRGEVVLDDDRDTGQLARRALSAGIECVRLCTRIRAVLPQSDVESLGTCVHGVGALEGGIDSRARGRGAASHRCGQTRRACRRTTTAHAADPASSWVSSRGTTKNPPRIAGAKASRAPSRGTCAPSSARSGIPSINAPVGLASEFSTAESCAMCSRIPLSSRARAGRRSGATPKRARAATACTSSAWTAIYSHPRSRPA